MTRVDIAFEGLEPVAFAHEGSESPVTRREGHPLEIGQGRRLLARPHVGPDHAAPLLARVGALADLVPEVALGRLAGHIHATPGDVVHPTVVHAAQAVVLVSPEEEGGAAVGAVLGEEPDAARRGPEYDEVLAEQPHAHGVAVGRRELVGGHDGHPILAEQLAHGGVGAHPGQQLVVLRGEHLPPPGLGMNGRPAEPAATVRTSLATAYRGVNQAGAPNSVAANDSPILSIASLFIR